jgi:hypothetical protein
LCSPELVVPLVELPVAWSPDCIPAPLVEPVPEVPPLVPLWPDMSPLWPDMPPLWPDMPPLWPDVLPLWPDVLLDCAWTLRALNIAATTEAPNRPFDNLFVFMPIS